MVAAMPMGSSNVIAPRYVSHTYTVTPPSGSYWEMVVLHVAIVTRRRHAHVFFLRILQFFDCCL